MDITSRPAFIGGKVSMACDTHQLTIVGTLIKGFSKLAISHPLLPSNNISYWRSSSQRFQMLKWQTPNIAWKVLTTVEDKRAWHKQKQREKRDSTCDVLVTSYGNYHQMITGTRWWMIAGSIINKANWNNESQSGSSRCGREATAQRDIGQRARGPLLSSNTN